MATFLSVIISCQKNVSLSIILLDGKYYSEVINEEHISANNWNVILEYCFTKTEDLVLPHWIWFQMSKNAHAETETKFNIIDTEIKEMRTVSFLGV